MKNANTVHSIPVEYNRETKTYSGELRIVKRATPKIGYYEVEQKHTQTERWPDGKVKVIKHRHLEARPFETGPIQPIRGTRAWKHSRLRSENK